MSWTTGAPAWIGAAAVLVYAGLLYLLFDRVLGFIATLLHVGLPGGGSMIVQTEGADATRPHEAVRLAFDPAACHLFDGVGQSLPGLERHPLAA